MLRFLMALMLISGMNLPVGADEFPDAYRLIQPRRVVSPVDTETNDAADDYERIIPSRAARASYLDSEENDGVADYGQLEETDFASSAASYENDVPDDSGFQEDGSGINERLFQPEDLNHPALQSTEEVPLVRFRKGFYQGASTALGYVGDQADTGLSITTVDVSASFAVPLGSTDNLLLLTPFVRHDHLTTSGSLDLPEDVYEAGIKAFWRKPLNDRWSSMVLVTPGMRTDFENTDQALRIFGLGLLTWQTIPDKLALSGGVTFTGRDDYPVLPAVGALWTPTPDWKIDIQFPGPRVGYRLSRTPGKDEMWAYLAGVFGGNTWSVQRPSGINDQLTLRDLRLVTGVEYLATENRSAFVEAGWIFGRTVEYASLPTERELDSAWMLRAGVSF